MSCIRPRGTELKYTGFDHLLGRRDTDGQSVVKDLRSVLGTGLLEENEDYVQLWSYTFGYSQIAGLKRS